MKQKQEYNCLAILLESIECIKKFDTLSGRGLVDDTKLELFKNSMHQLFEITARIHQLNQQLEQYTINDLQSIEQSIIELYKEYYAIYESINQIADEIRHIYLFIKRLKNVH